MPVRQLATTIATAFVAICVALAVPVSQLRTHAVIVTCCCSNPAACHCPDHQPVADDLTTMGACHKAQHELASVSQSAFVAPIIETTTVVTRVALAETGYVSSPPKTPPAPEPSGPS